ncbi:MAG TPA: VOC family protein [Candidatus Dormibacteraeota bacterium]|nr:VOC family protein [Candidatus Dormibacteraeota bacterium]
MGRVSHFEITADDPKRAAAFYEKAFGWKINDWGGPFTYLLAATGEKDEIGIDGAIMDRTDHKQAVINTISVDKWEAGADAVKKAGGHVLQEKTAVPGQGYFAYCKDTEGNIFGIFEADETAAAEVGAGAASESA